MWQLDRIAKRYGCLPSAVMGIRQAGLDVLAWDFDCAVFTFGAWFDGKMAERTKGTKNRPGKPKYTAEQLLGVKQGGATTKQRPRTTRDILSAMGNYSPLVRKADGTLVRGQTPGRPGPARPQPATNEPRPAKPWEPDQDEARTRIPPSDWS